jgi:ribosomal protein S10
LLAWGVYILAGADHAKVLDEHVSKITEIAKETAANVSGIRV